MKSTRKRPAKSRRRVSPKRESRRRPKIVKVAEPFTYHAARALRDSDRLAHAKANPRDVAAFTNRAIELTTKSTDTAELCFYRIRQKEKGKLRLIEGAGIRFAELMLYAWTNVDISGRLVSKDGRFVKAEGTALDLERNVSFQVETERSIADWRGRSYPDEIVQNIAGAAVSIAIRNVSLRVVPRAFWEPVWEQARAVARGTQETMTERYRRALAHFKSLGISLEQIVGYLGGDVRVDHPLTIDDLETLTGLKTAIKDGDVKLEDVFPPPVDDTDREVAAILARLNLTPDQRERYDTELAARTPAQRIVFLRQHEASGDRL